MECDLQNMGEVIVGLYKMVLQHLVSPPYLAWALRYALSKITALWNLVTLRDVSVWPARECLSAQWDGTSLGIGFTWPPRDNKIDSLITRQKVRETWQLETLYWPTLQVSTSPEMVLQNQNGVRYPKSERGYCRSLQHNPIGTRITSTPHMSSKICPIKITALWHLVTLRDILVRRARECLSAQWDGRRLGLGFTWTLQNNRIDSSIPQWTWGRFGSWQLCTGQHYKFQHHPRWRHKIKIE